MFAGAAPVAPASSASLFVPSFSSVVWAAFRAGSCGFVSWRVSSRALSGRVAVASFAEFARAARFARAQARLLGRSVCVRPGPVIGGRVRSWRVSVPVALWPSEPAGQLVLLRAGVRGVAASLRALGFVASAA